MAAVSALWMRHHQPPAGPLLRRMLSAQTIYGAGQAASYVDGDVALGVNPAKSPPPGDGRDLPIVWSPDRSSCLIADIRLDNPTDLARELGLPHPETLSHSSLLLSSWIRWGPACVHHLLGGFAFVVWQPGERKIFAARDHGGDRPLFYSRGDRFLAIASMPKALLALPGVFQGFEERRIADWLVMVKPQPQSTFFRGVCQLPKGHFLLSTPDSFTCEAYWRPQDVEPVRYPRDEDYAEALLALFDQSTAARLSSGEEVGSQLSAGLDSGSVTASAATLLGQAGRRITAFTAVPRTGFHSTGQRFDDEGPAAAEIAALYPNLDHVLIDSSKHDLLLSIRRWTDALDEPAKNATNSMWILVMLEEARARGLGIMLEGSLGNSTFSYETLHLLGTRFRTGQWLALWRMIRRMRANGALGYRNALREALAPLVSSRPARLFLPRSGDNILRFCLAEEDLVRRYDLQAASLERMHVGASSSRQGLIDLFEESDPGPAHAAANALSGLEVRDPTSDLRLYEFCLGVPEEQFLVGDQSRSLARRAMKDRLPTSALSRYQRGNQSADWHLTLSAALPSLREELGAIESSGAADGFIDLKRMRHLLDHWPATQPDDPDADLLLHGALTRAISLGCFLRSHAAQASSSLTL